MVLGLGRCDLETLLRGVVEKGNGGSSAQRDENLVVSTAVRAPPFRMAMDAGAEIHTSPPTAQGRPLPNAVCAAAPPATRSYAYP